MVRAWLKADNKPIGPCEKRYPQRSQSETVNTPTEDPVFMNLLRSDIAPDARTRCAACGSTAYRKVIARDTRGQLTPNGMYQCCGCPTQFKTLNEWRRVLRDSLPFLGGMATGL